MNIIINIDSLEGRSHGRKAHCARVEWMCVDTSQILMIFFSFFFVFSVAEEIVEKPLRRNFARLRHSENDEMHF